ncbi:hypothetical protein HN709_02615, partial [Candidatus Peregrinibacteria bacterium]|nr:hypothetical protein [Candidatus Peregrinibacteria bacterium]
MSKTEKTKTGKPKVAPKQAPKRSKEERAKLQETASDIVSKATAAEKRSDSSKAREAEAKALASTVAGSRESKEVLEQEFLRRFKLGKYKIKKGHLEAGESDVVGFEFEDLRSDLILLEFEGQADKVWHKRGRKRKAWYAGKLEAAQALGKAIKMKGLVDINNYSNEAKLLTILDEIIADPSLMSYRGLRKLIKDGKATKKEIFSGEGLLNLILSFQRSVSPLIKRGVKYTDLEKHYLDPSKDSSKEQGKRVKLITLVYGERLVRVNKAKVQRPKPKPVPPKPKPVPPKPKPVPPKPKPKPVPVPPKPPVKPEPVPLKLKTEDKPTKVSGTRGRARVAPVENMQWDENLEGSLSSSITSTLENYKALGINGLLEGMEAVPPQHRGAFLEKFMKEVLQNGGTQDLAKVQEELQRAVKGESDQYGMLYLGSIQARIREAKTKDEKDFWRVQQDLLRLTTGEKWSPNVQSTRENAYKTLKDIDMDKLPKDLREVAKATLKSMELMLRQGMAADMVETSAKTLGVTFGEHEDLEKFMKLSDADKKEELSGGIDYEVDVYFASMNVYNALMYLIRYKFPLDVEENPKLTIKNPVKYYYDELVKSGGVIAPISFAPEQPPKFIDFESELDLFNQYQDGSEDMGETSVLTDWDGDKEAFGSDHDGLIGASEKVFGLSSFSYEGVFDTSAFFGGSYLIDSEAKDLDSMGGMEQLMLLKIKNATNNGHYDEARDLILEVLGHDLDGMPEAKDPAKADRIVALQKEVLEEEGTKLRAQHKLRLEAQAESLEKTEPNNPLVVLWKTKPGEFDALVGRLATNQAEEIAVRKFYGELAEKVVDGGNWQTGSWEIRGTYKRELLSQLDELNGYGWFDLTAENEDFAASIAITLAEVLIIEAATMGVGGFIAGATGVARAGVGVERTIAGSRALGLQGKAWNAGAALRTRTAASGLARLPGAARAGAVATRAGTYVADGASWHSRITQNVLHGGAFVEGQAMLHGHVVDPFSVDGAMQIGSMAAMFGVLGKMQQFLRGGTSAARNMAGGSTRIIDRVRLGRMSNWLGRTGDRLAQTGRAGRVAVSSTEIAAEITGLHYFADVEQWGMIQAHYMSGGEHGISKTEAEAMMETDAFKRWTHEAAVVIGLRTWRKLKTARKKGPYEYDKEGEPIYDRDKEGVYDRDAEGYYIDKGGYFRDPGGFYVGPKGRLKGKGPEALRLEAPKSTAVVKAKPRPKTKEKAAPKTEPKAEPKAKTKPKGKASGPKSRPKVKVEELMKADKLEILTAPKGMLAELVAKANNLGFARELLGIKKSDTLTEKLIRDKRAELILKFHPDRNPAHAEAAGEVMKAINAAVETVKRQIPKKADAEVPPKKKSPVKPKPKKAPAEKPAAKKAPKEKAAPSPEKAPAKEPGLWSRWRKRARDAWEKSKAGKPEKAPVRKAKPAKLEDLSEKGPKIIDIAEAKRVRERGLPSRDVFGRKHKATEVDPAKRAAEMKRAVESKEASRAQEAYLAKEYGPEATLVKELASQIPAMHPECRMSISLPARNEAANIYKALHEYTVRQKTSKGEPVNPDHFEINVFINKPNAKAKPSAETVAEVERFKADHPEYHVNIIFHTFNFKGGPIMGEIYKTMVDTAVYRNTQRADGAAKERLILRSGGADAKEKSPLFLESVMKAFENPRLGVYKSESQLPQEVLDASPLLDLAYRAECGLNRLFTHAQSNLGLGSYSAKLYAEVGGFKKTARIAEEKDLSTRMARRVRESRGKTEIRKDLHVNALDDPRRIVWAMFHGKTMGERYNSFGGEKAERSLREVDWNRKAVEGPLPRNMKLSAKNLSREMSAFYVRYLRDVGGGRTVSEFKKANPGATPEQVRDVTYEATNQMFGRLFDSMGISKDSYRFVRRNG